MGRSARAEGPGGWPAGVLAAVGAAALTALLALSGILAPIERPAGDAVLRLATRLAPAPPAGPADVPDVALVLIDPRSLREEPGWPWPRGHHARVVEALARAGAAAIAFDIDFSARRAPREDAVLAAALRSAGRVVLAGFRQRQQLEGGLELEVVNLPAPALSQAAAAVGSVTVPLDPDGLVRRSLRRSPLAGREVPSLAAAALAVARSTARAGPTAEGLGGTGSPARSGVRSRAARPEEESAAFPLDFRRVRPAIPVLSYADVLRGEFDRARVAGRAVFVGASAAELQDLWPTPLGPGRPGVLIQALAYRTLAAGSAGLPVLRTAGPGARMAEVGVLLLVAALAGAGAHRRRLAAAALLGTAVVPAHVALAAATGRLVEPLLPLVALGLHHLLSLEVVRRQVGRMLALRERSLEALFLVAETSSAEAPARSVRMALSLLGEVVGATGVALLRAREDGALSGERLEWRRTGEGALGCEETARGVLESRRVRLFEGEAPAAAAPCAAVYAPLLAGSVPVGALVVERRGTRPFSSDELHMIATVGAHVALSAENLRLLRNLRSTFDASIEALASAVEARDGYTESHCRRLAILSTLMGERLGLSAEELEAIRLGALLHDVGKIGIRDEILLKPGRFDPDERLEMQRHTVIGHQIVAPIHGLSEITRACVRHHHERWDGTGYPDGLAGEEIPLGARIVSIVDVWDALSTARPYKPAYPEAKVRELLRKGRGSAFDPPLVDLFLEILETEGEELRALVSEPSPLTATPPRAAPEEEMP